MCVCVQVCVVSDYLSYHIRGRAGGHGGRAGGPPVWVGRAGGRPGGLGRWVGLYACTCVSSLLVSSS